MTHLTMRPGRFRGLGLLIATLFFAVSASAATPTQLYIFGDSLSDTGNVTILNGIPLPPYFPGHFSNGNIWVETLASNLGLSAPLPSLAGGTNYAFGGAATGAPPAIPSPTTSPTLIDQAGMFVGSGITPAATDLFIVFGGGNDVRAGDTSVSVANMSSVITTLAGAGATRFLVPNLPDIGKTPEAIAGGPGVVAGATFLSTTFNTDLAVELASLRASLGVEIIEFDIFSILNNVLANPASFGFTNTNQPCFDGAVGIGGPGNVCANPDQYIFWDGIHPTTAMHTIIGNLATAAVVPVPAAVWLFASALGLLGWTRRSRQL